MMPGANDDNDKATGKSMSSVHVAYISNRHLPKLWM